MTSLSILFPYYLNYIFAICNFNQNKALEMMPIDHDPTSNTTSPSFNMNPQDFPPSPHIDLPLASARAVSPCLEEVQRFCQDSSSPPRFSTLHGSLRPIILKVFCCQKRIYFILFVIL